MLERCEATDDQPDPWSELNAALGVETWPTPMHAQPAAPRASLPPEEAWAPSWWHGDEGQNFLATQGVTLP
jgi:hypothetical protein